ncbi:MAG: AraC family transcriptional regulator, partial [Aquabacterium sp.]
MRLWGQQWCRSGFAPALPAADARIMVARSVRQGTGRPEASKRRRTLAFVRYLSQVIPRLSAVRPITVVAGGILRHMDTLSLILDDMRLRGTFVYAELTAPWSLSLDAPGSASFHIVTDGQAWLLREGAEAQLLQRGDLVILPGGQPHRVQDKPAAAARSRDILGELQEVRGLEALREGGGGAATHMVSGIFRFDVNMAAPLVAALPPLLQVRSHDAMPPLWLAIGLQFLEQEVASARPAQQAVLNRLLDVMFIESV